MKTLYPDTRFFVIGNADEQRAPTETVREHDIVIRFNNPNPSCTLVADWLFVANGCVQTKKLQLTHEQLFAPDMVIFFRYQLQDILQARYQRVSYFSRLKYLLRFPAFKRRYRLQRFEQHYVETELYQECTRLIGNNQPSTGLLAVYHVLTRHPGHPVFTHNFTHQGWVGHNWDGERELMARLTAEGKIRAV